MFVEGKYIYAENGLILFDKCSGHPCGSRMPITRKTLHDPEGNKLSSPVCAGMEYYVEGKDPYEDLNKTLMEIADLKSQLAATDYQCLKWCEGYLTDDEYQPIKEQRQELRDKINELENSL